MRKILFLMIPMNFSGSIYSKAATAICFPVIAACFAASAWSNRIGAETLFSSLPPWALEAVKAAVLIIDPLAWLAFVLFVVSTIAFRKLEKEQDRVEFQKLDLPAYKRRALLAAAIFFAITASLTWLSYRLSDAGGKRGAGNYIDNKHAPAPLASIIDGRLQALASEKKALAGGYAGVLAEVVAARAAAEKTEAATAGWNKGKGKEDWKAYNANMDAKTARAAAQAKIDAIRSAIEAKEAIAEKAHGDALDAEKRAHGQQSAKHQALASEARDAMSVAVSCWTLAGLFAQAVACALTFGQYEATAYALLVYEMKERAGNAREAEKQMLALSGGSETGARAVRENRLPRWRQQQALPENKQQVQEIEAPAQPSKVPATAIMHIVQTAEADTILQALDGQGFKLAWVRQWRVALADPGLMPKPFNPQGMSKEEIAEKYGCGSSQVDNLRRCRRIITAFAGSESAFLAAIEKA